MGIINRQRLVALPLDTQLLKAPEHSLLIAT